MDEEHGLPAARVFDALGAEYERAFADSIPHHASLLRLLEHIPPHSRVLDVGSGTGRPTAQTLADAGHQVLGVDVSPVMVDLAARHVPGATFVCADIRELPLEERSFDVVCSYFSLLQMSRDDQSRLLRRLGRLLLPGGVLAVATVPLDVEDADVVFMGQKVQATSFGAEAFTELVAGAGFTILWEQSGPFTPAYEGAVAEPQLFLHCERV
ncbi:MULTISPECIES: class I SAM-dependent methyltransferase [unclassified Streptomyces]|uniref:class I SAM-dependent methyltransferase n=1 Tax=unclassified Streptomyces TaxID=2593676 RepID=UPI00224E9B79|nr:MULTISPECIES: class I SAM-dependent methyltransferase [unclassified Streptomyces]WSP59171.1 class I SAM-dependent methyltransferase [Streptomyces sp. NBC_01241]WSU20307.1 class I SAM-dependent methyltransferase [Streptomyces sp. NBC_01108]MCX4790921.1 class I SAM-dependent methyltransferase [Streptomyces sp. NBC_01221]MCX4793352.1 class I SAM-dependent methyltransferase [Streptomyces sp. NBC_01242]WSJ34793.1 class I SAM-dependent methyltransferase [Streptomyces sp. NBC_01321]